MKNILPELYAQKPKNCYKPNPDFWWKPGLKEPRIEALKKAIELCEKKLQ
jgi:hypothetical protein